MSLASHKIECLVDGVPTWECHGVSEHPDAVEMALRCFAEVAVRSSVEVERLSLRCDTRDVGAFDIRSAYENARELALEIARDG